MKIGNSTGSFWYGGEPEGIFARMMEVGYDAADWGIPDIQADYYHDDKIMEEYCQKVRAGVEKTGITLWQAHGPWPTDDKTPETRAEGWRCFHRAVYMCHLAGCPRLVIHPQMPFGWGEEQDADYAEKLTIELLQDLMPDCEKYGVTICLENMPMKAHRISPIPKIVEAVQKVGSDHIGICLDTGHVNVYGTDLGEMVRCAAPYLQSLHVHDNDGQRDAHQLPFLGCANWESFIKALAEIHYQGPMILESAGVLPQTGSMEVRDMFEKFTASVARYLADQVEAARK